MRPDTNSLDLNNLPDDYSTGDDKQAFDASLASELRRKTSGGKDGKDDGDKVYECRFCSLKFCKSQALGGHMNRHRQERVKETLNRARQLVFNSDNQAAHGPFLRCHPVGAGSYHPTSNILDPYQPRTFTGFSSTVVRPPQPHQSCFYTSPSRVPSCPSQHPINDYQIGHVVSSRNSRSTSQACSVNYGMSSCFHQQRKHTCIGGAVRVCGGGGSEREGSMSNQEEGLYWRNSSAAVGGSQQQLLDPTSSARRDRKILFRI